MRELSWECSFIRSLEKDKAQVSASSQAERAFREQLCMGVGGSRTGFLDLPSLFSAPRWAGAEKAEGSLEGGAVGRCSQ